MRSVFDKLMNGEPTLTYEVRNSIVTDGNWRTRFVLVRAVNVGNGETLKLNIGQMGLERLVHLNVQPIGLPCSITWNGDVVDPAVVVNNLHDDEVTFIVEAKGR